MLHAKNSKELETMLRDDVGAEIELGNGVYELEYDKRQSIYLRAPSPLGTTVRLHKTLNPAYFSNLQRVTFVPMGDFAAVNLDKSSYTYIDTCIFNSLLNDERNDENVGNIETWDSFNRKGVGIETTDANNGDDAYGIRITACLFQTLVRGISMGFPKEKGTVALTLEHNVFNGCWNGIYGTRVGELRMRGGIVQLSAIGIVLDDSRSNWIEQVHFERSDLDIYLDENTCYNQLLWNDAPLQKIEDKGYMNRIKVMRHRNVDRPCKKELQAK